MVATMIGPKRALHADTTLVSRVLARAFADDPVFSWVFDDRVTRPAYVQASFDVFTAHGIETGDVLFDDGGGGAAIWTDVIPGGASPDDDIGDALVAAAGPHIERLGTVGEMMGVAHPMEERHAYLHFLGTAPEWQGTGIGGRLLAAKLAEVDAAGLPAYLEATTLRSAALYARHGFEHLWKTIDLPGGPRMYPMWRPARR